MSANPRRVLIVKLSAIGDVLHTLPVAVALRRALPEAEIAWAVEGRARELLTEHPAIDRVISLRRHWLTSPASRGTGKRPHDWQKPQVFSESGNCRYPAEISSV